MLPARFVCRFPGTLPEIEQLLVVEVQGATSAEAADRLRCDSVTLPSAIRWTRRRVRNFASIALPPKAFLIKGGSGDVLW
jgi:hypothetical protein